MFLPVTADPEQGLTDAQRRVVAHDAGHLLVVAGAGTGKTTTLAARVARLVAGGTLPERILLLTFSRRAAAELLRRAGHLCGADVAGRAWGGTFHAVAWRLVRLHGAAAGMACGSLLDQADAADLLRLCRAELDAHDGRAGPPAPPPAGAVDVPPGGRPRQRRARADALAAILSRAVNTSTPVSEVVARWYPWCADELDELTATFAAYTARKRAAHVLDYDDLLLCWAALLRTPAVAPLLQDRFDHVLVDEYQDTNALQVAICEGMVAGSARLTAVGDDAQAIYSFRGGSAWHERGSPCDGACDVLLLEDNHRSTPEVLRTANAVLAGAPPGRYHDKVLRSGRPSGPRPALVTCADEAHQSAEVCARILEHHERGVHLREQAVLVRAGHHSALLELELTARRIPFVKYGGLRFLEAAHVKDLLAACRLVDNPRDELAWFRVLGLHDGVGPATARRAAAAAAGGELPSRLAPDLVLALAEARASGEAAGAARVAVDRIRLWLDPIVARRYDSPLPRLGDLDALAAAAGASPSLGRFLMEVTLDPPAATGDLAGPPHLDDDHLTVSTIHSAKGGEWKVVHLLSLVDGNLPSDLATGDAEQVEEERRLLYVAMTRAKDELHCYAPLRQHHHRRSGGVRGDRHGYAPLSRFLDAGVLATMSREGVALDLLGADGEPGPVGAGVVIEGAPAALPGVDDLIGALLR